MQHSVNEPDTFDEKTTTRTFKLSLGDISEGRVLPFIMKEIDKNAKIYLWAAMPIKEVTKFMLWLPII